MAVAEFATPSRYNYSSLVNYSSKRSYVSTSLYKKRLIACTPLPSTQHARICCSANREVQAPVALDTAELKKQAECYGVFCLTYDLKALASGEVFGPDQPVALKLLGSERSIQALEGVAMELEDSLFPLLREVIIGIDPYEVFQDVEWALLIGAKPRGPGMERADLLDINGQIFAEQGKALNAVASRNVKVVVVGNPCNTK
ncbi:hypothetical protein Leryth_016672 [Lithospermum erythrorhizon]|nr:hypothetical protein Leryth_016672 [Lithospermum erythrorhizon]